MERTGEIILSKLILIFISAQLFSNNLSNVADEMNRKCSSLETKRITKKCYKSYEKKFESQLMKEISELEKDPAFSTNELSKLRKKIIKRVRSNI